MHIPPFCEAENFVTFFFRQTSKDICFNLSAPDRKSVEYEPPGGAKILVHSKHLFHDDMTSTKWEWAQKKGQEMQLRTDR